MAEKWRHLVEASEDSMTPADPTALGRASTVTDVTTSVSIEVVVEAEVDVLMSSVKGRLLRWATMTYQTLKLETKMVALYSKSQVSLTDACVIIMQQSFVIRSQARALKVVVSSSTYSIL